MPWASIINITHKIANALDIRRPNPYINIVVSLEIEIRHPAKRYLRRMQILKNTFSKVCCMHDKLS